MSVWYLPPIACMLFSCKQKTAYEMRISDWSSDVCSSDLWGAAVMDSGISVSARGVKSANLFITQTEDYACSHRKDRVSGGGRRHRLRAGPAHGGAQGLGPGAASIGRATCGAGVGQ